MLIKIYLACSTLTLGHSGKELPANAGDTRYMGSKPGSGRSPGEGNGKLLQYSSLGNPIDRGAWRATVHGFAKSQTQLSIHTHPLTSLTLFLNWQALCCCFWQKSNWKNSLSFKNLHTSIHKPHTHRLTFLSCFLITSYRNTINMRNGMFLAISVNKGCRSH